MMKKRRNEICGFFFIVIAVALIAEDINWDMMKVVKTLVAAISLSIGVGLLTYEDKE